MTALRRLWHALCDIVGTAQSAHSSHRIESPTFPELTCTHGTPLSQLYNCRHCTGSGR